MRRGRLRSGGQEAQPMATTMITGGTGFIGAHLARELLEAGDKVVLFDLAPDVPMLRSIGIEGELPIVRGDVTYLQDLLRTIRVHHVDRIAHTAYIIGPENEDNPP